MLLKLDGSGLLHLQLYRALRAQVLGGRLHPGTRLPSTRVLAVDNGLSRNTVTLAFEQLIGEGYASVRRGSGTYVTAHLPDEATSVLRRPDAGLTRPAVRPRLSRFGETIRDWRVSWAARTARLACDFRYGRPAFRDFPHATWRQHLARRARRASARDLDYGPPEGAPSLREAIADYLHRARAVVCDAARVVIVNGSQQALDLTARVLLDRGDRVLLEEMHYAGARSVFLAAGARIVTAPVDGDGLDVAALGRRRRGIRLAYVTPSHQFPTGAIMPLSRRLDLLAWAAREDAHVLEDDYDGEYRYVGRPLESLQGLDRTGRVIYTGTFSKLMFPALRLGYVVVPEALVGPFVAAKALADTGGASLEQLALADFIRAGHFERHVRRSRARNAARRAVLLDAIAKHLGDRVEVAGVNAGIHVLLWVRRLPAKKLPALVRRAEAAGVGVFPITPHCAKPPDRAGVLLGYASLTDAAIRDGIRRLAIALDDLSA